ncbi:MAG: (deoxy)nucleoside triphosphate pyrophosphohydrolase [Bacillota bacterium]
MKKIEVVAAVISDKENRILCAQKTAHDNDAFKWEFPGGKVEENESFTDALKREIKEELNLDVEVHSLIVETGHETVNGSIVLKAFSASIESGKINVNVHHQVKWINTNELMKLDWLDADQRILGEIIEYQNNDL